MHIQIADYNNAQSLFYSIKPDHWRELETVLLDSPLFLQASDQAGKVGEPIFDPKATNAHLKKASFAYNWHPIPVPEELNEFGMDWDAGKDGVLAEWQFSNYPFLWNNIIRSESVFTGAISLPSVGGVQALVIVTKSGALPSSNSTLYYEQARAQLETVTRFGTFSIPIRLVGLMLPGNVKRMNAVWTIYNNPRYDREPQQQDLVEVTITWGARGNYGSGRARLTLA
jgi:hypothetical protein